MDKPMCQFPFFPMTAASIRHFVTWRCCLEIQWDRARELEKGLLALPKDLVSVFQL